MTRKQGLPRKRYTGNTHLDGISQASVLSYCLYPREYPTDPLQESNYGLRTSRAPRITDPVIVDKMNT